MPPGKSERTSHQCSRAARPAAAELEDRRGLELPHSLEERAVSRRRLPRAEHLLARERVERGARERGEDERRRREDRDAVDLRRSRRAGGRRGRSRRRSPPDRRPPGRRGPAPDRGRTRARDPRGFDTLASAICARRLRAPRCRSPPRRPAPARWMRPAVPFRRGKTATANRAPERTSDGLECARPREKARDRGRKRACAVEPSAPCTSRIWPTRQEVSSRGFG